MAYATESSTTNNNPRNVAQLDKTSTEVGTGLVGAPECGDVNAAANPRKPETQVIEEARFKTFGCGSAIAVHRWPLEWIKAAPSMTRYGIKTHDSVKELSLPPVNIHCSVLAEAAISRRHMAIGRRKMAGGRWPKLPPQPHGKGRLCRTL